METQAPIEKQKNSKYLAIAALVVVLIVAFGAWWLYAPDVSPVSEDPREELLQHLEALDARVEAGGRLSEDELLEVLDAIEVENTLTEEDQMRLLLELEKR